MKFLQSKGSKIFWIIVLILFVIVLLELGSRYYDQWKDQKRVEELAQELERIEQERYAHRAADTTGGQTPQETLGMFIEAVENEDYELASKYFVLERQEKWKLHLSQIVEAGKVEVFLGPLIQGKSSNGSYSFDKTTFSIHDPVLISFVLYPSGNWKIEEI